MRYLLDTHALIWVALEERDQFSDEVASWIAADPASVYVSAASAWEIATKYRLGKLPEMGHFVEQFEARIASTGFRALGMSMRHSLLAGKLDGPHKDPFDRFIAAQSLIEGLILLSNDRALDGFGVQRVW